MKTKKGSHVGAVISFVVFIIFITFIYTITQPVIRSGNKESILERVKIEILEKSSTDLTTTSVALQSPINTEPCVALNSFFSDTGMTKKVIVIDSSGNKLSAVQSGNDLLITRSDVSQHFFWIYESEEFNEILTGNPSCTSEEFNIGLLKSNNRLFESKIIGLINNYSDNYLALKESMHISRSINFGLTFTYNNGSTITAGTLPTSNIDIYAEKIYIQYINQDASMEQGSLNIITW